MFCWLSLVMSTSHTHTHTHTHKAHTHMNFVSAMSSGFLLHNLSQDGSSSLKQGGGGGGFLQSGKGGANVLHSNIEAKIELRHQAHAGSSSLEHGGGPLSRGPGRQKVLTPRFRDFF